MNEEATVGVATIKKKSTIDNNRQKQSKIIRERSNDEMSHREKRYSIEERDKEAEAMRVLFGEKVLC